MLVMTSLMAHLRTFSTLDSPKYLLVGDEGCIFWLCHGQLILGYCNWLNFFNYWSLLVFAN